MTAAASPPKPAFSVSVRNLVEHVLRHGDLRSDFWSAVQPVEGIRAHQHIQRLRPAGYESEVTVRHEVVRDAYTLTIGGRIDGLWRREGEWTVEEIKSTYLAFDALEKNPNPIHWGQAQCYAFMVASREGLPGLDVQLTYVNPESWRSQSVTRTFSLDELTRFFDDLLERYLAWIELLAHWSAARDESLRRLAFPFEGYRPGQRAMAVAVFRTIRDRGHLLVQAATGIGKTIAALYPALKALGDRLVPKVIFLTARTTGRLAAESALERLRGQGLRLKATTLTAKDKICFTPHGACLPDECEFAAGYYDRLNAALIGAFQHDVWNRETIERLARDHRVCPFEFSLELVEWSDCVIGDYNYAFDPTVMLQRLFAPEGGRHALLVDEAHNLVDRGREMFSAALAKSSIQSMLRILKTELPGLARPLSRVHGWMTAQRRRCRESGGPIVAQEPPQALVERLRAFVAAAEKWLRLNLRPNFREELVALFFDGLRFVRVAEQYSASYATISEAQGPELVVKLFCIDPSPGLREAWTRFRAAVLFSATLTPSDYFQKILGCDPCATRLNIPSPFPPENLSVHVAGGISTLYRRRSDSSAAVCRAIATLVRARTGHYMLFFPSYEYLGMILEPFVALCPEVETVIQVPEMGEEQRRAFLERFEAPVSRTLAGFAVMGGIFGEGIDLHGERLTGAVIVGVGLPGIGTERELIRAYFDRTNGLGFAFAYQYPGINRVLQAAGRVIRTEQDRGVLMLIDQRYDTRRYRSLLPSPWRLRPMGDEAGMQRALSAFWRSDL